MRMEIDKENVKDSGSNTATNLPDDQISLHVRDGFVKITGSGKRSRSQIFPEQP